MKKMFILLYSIVLSAQSPFDTPQYSMYDLSVFDTDRTLSKTKYESEKVRCRYVCDKKLDREERIEDAILFYKNSKKYTFTSID